MKELLATVNESGLSSYEPLASLGALVPNVPKDHLLVLIAVAFGGPHHQDKDLLSKAIQQMIDEYGRGELSIEKNGDEYRLYQV